MNTEKLKPNKNMFALKKHTPCKIPNSRLEKNGELMSKTAYQANQKDQIMYLHTDGIYKVKGWQGWKYWLGTADRGILQ